MEQDAARHCPPVAAGALAACRLPAGRHCDWSQIDSSGFTLFTQYVHYTQHSHQLVTRPTCYPISIYSHYIDSTMIIIIIFCLCLVPKIFWISTFLGPDVFLLIVIIIIIDDNVVICLSFLLLRCYILYYITYIYIFMWRMKAVFFSAVLKQHPAVAGWRMGNVCS